MKKLIYLILSLIFIGCKKNGSQQQPPNQVPYEVLPFSKVYGGGGNDYFNSLIVTADSGFIAVGKTNSLELNKSKLPGDVDAWIIKMDKDGKKVWEKIFAGTGSDEANSVIETIDGGFLVAGRTNSVDGDIKNYQGDYDIWLAKFDKNGNKIWSKNFGGTGIEYCGQVIKANNGGFIVAGRTNSNNGDISVNHGDYDAWLIKIDDSGNKLWQKTYGGTYYDAAYAVTKANDGGYVLAGEVQSINGDVSGNHGASDCWAVKVDENGNIAWQRPFGGTNFEYANAIAATPDGGYLLAGECASKDGQVTSSHTGSEDWVVKINNSGDIIWQKTIGGSMQDYGNSIIVAPDGSYLIAGSTESNNGDVTGFHGPGNADDAWVVKMNSNGNMIWQKDFGGSSYDAVFSIVPYYQGYYVIAGVSDSLDGDIINGNAGLQGYYNGWLLRFKE